MAALPYSITVFNWYSMPAHVFAQLSQKGRCGMVTLECTVLCNGSSVGWYSSRVPRTNWLRMLLLLSMTSGMFTQVCTRGSADRQPTRCSAGAARSCLLCPLLCFSHSPLPRNREEEFCLKTNRPMHYWYHSFG